MILNIDYNKKGGSIPPFYVSEYIRVVFPFLGIVFFGRKALAVSFDGRDRNPFKISEEAHVLLLQGMTVLVADGIRIRHILFLFRSVYEKGSEYTEGRCAGQQVLYDVPSSVR